MSSREPEGTLVPQGGGLEARGTANLADILERVLDKGIVIAGDIRINLLDIELLTIKLRLLVASVDKARELGIDWWEHDRSLTSGNGRSLDERLDRIERALGVGAEPQGAPSDHEDQGS
jgi:hypothetical protein